MRQDFGAPVADLLLLRQLDPEHLVGDVGERARAELAAEHQAGQLHAVDQLDPVLVRPQHHVFEGGVVGDELAIIEQAKSSQGLDREMIQVEQEHRLVLRRVDLEHPHTRLMRVEPAAVLWVGLVLGALALLGHRDPWALDPVLRPRRRLAVETAADAGSSAMMRAASSRVRTISAQTSSSSSSAAPSPPGSPGARRSRPRGCGTGRGRGRTGARGRRPRAPRRTSGTGAPASQHAGDQRADRVFLGPGELRRDRRRVAARRPARSRDARAPSRASRAAIRRRAVPAQASSSW